MASGMRTLVHKEYGRRYGPACHGICRSGGYAARIELNIERDSRSNVKAAYGEYAIEYSGRIRRRGYAPGQSLVVWAIEEVANSLRG